MPMRHVASEPAGPAIASSPYVYNARAIDPSGGTITYSLDAQTFSYDGAPQIDARSGRFTWTPPRAGAYEVTLRARSTSGFEVSQSVTVHGNWLRQFPRTIYRQLADLSNA